MIKFKRNLLVKFISDPPGEAQQLEGKAGQILSGSVQEEENLVFLIQNMSHNLHFADY